MGTAWEHDHVRMDADERRISEALDRWHRRTVFDPDAPCDFTPTKVLYDAYRRWLPRNDEHATPLNERYFGRLLNKALGLDRTERAKRVYRGERVWGYLGLRGPGSIVVTNKRGRRYDTRKAPHKAAAPAAEVPGGSVERPDAGA